MPRKSAAALATITQITDHRPGPPLELTEEQQEEWRAIVGRLPSGWFARETQPLLVAYLRHWATARFLTRQIEHFHPDWIVEDGGFERYSQWLALRARETKVMADLATKLRLTNQSRYMPNAAARLAQREPWGSIGADGELVPRTPPWERHK